MHALSWILTSGMAFLASRVNAEPNGIDILKFEQGSPARADPLLEATCGPIAQHGVSWKLSDAKAGRFLVFASGAISINEDADADTVEFSNTEAAIAVLDGPGSRAAQAHIACGRIANSVYKLPSGAKPKDLLLLRVFDVSTGKPSGKLITYRRNKLTELQQKERAALYRILPIRTFAVAARTSLISLTDDSLDQVANEYADLKRRVADIRKNFECDSPISLGMLSPAICEEVFAIALIAESIDLTLKAGRGKTGDVRARELEASKVADRIAALKGEEPPSVVDPDVHCMAIEELNWLYASQMPRLVNRSQLPNVDSVYGGRYGVKRAPVIDVVPGSRSFAFVVANVPIEANAFFREREGKRIALDGITIASAFIGLGLKTSFPSLARGLLKFGVKDLLRTFEARRRLENQSLICPRVKGESSRVGFRVDEGLPPANGIENLARVFDSVKESREVSIALCSGECSALPDEKTDKALLSLVPSNQFTWTLLAELGAGIALGEGSALAGLSAPEFVPVLGTEGADQAFELARTADPRNVVSTSLLVGYRLPCRLLLGIGPTMLVGASGAVFQQWNLRAGFKVGNGMYLTAGPSVRAIQMANDYEIGDRVWVVRPASGSASPPAFGKHYEAVWELQFGLSFDLAEVGGLSSDIYKALGGGK